MKKSLGLHSLSKAIKEHLRILKIAKKPSKDEVIRSIKVSLIGIIILGIIGFIFQLFFSFLG